MIYTTPMQMRKIIQNFHRKNRSHDWLSDGNDILRWKDGNI